MRIVGLPGRLRGRQRYVTTTPISPAACPCPPAGDATPPAAPVLQSALEDGRHGDPGRTRPELSVERLRTHLLTAAPGTLTGKQLTTLSFAEQHVPPHDHVRPATLQFATRPTSYQNVNIVTKHLVATGK
jgi:hypothetical protein